MRTLAAANIALVMALLLGWQYLHGGVPAHHLLADPSLPMLSNWWGLLTLPLLTWFLLGHIERRHLAAPLRAHGDAAAFAGGLVFGAVVALLFTAGKMDVLDTLVQLLALLAVFYPIYRAACVLGFVIAMTWTFGAVLPMIGAAVFAAIGWGIYHGVRLATTRIGLLRR